MSVNTADNKRIAKNTLFLYARMLLMLLVSLYTSRVILKALGATDYGLYNVVGGVVTLFTFLNGGISEATQRYINIDLAQKKDDHLKLVFRTSVQIYFLIAVLIIILAETLGLWIVSTQLKVPEGRMSACLWVYQLSIISCVLNVMCLPCNADIIAHEEMDMFAYISIIDAFLKLFVAFLISRATSDRLILYALLLVFIGIIDMTLYHLYCRRKFNEYNLSLKPDKSLLKEMSIFTGWSLCGNFAFALYTQGLNILLNIFFGPVVNAARGLAVQVQSAVSGFVSNIQIAMNPQIVKSYASTDLRRMHTLMFASSKICFFLLFIIVLPLSIEAKEVLTVWLKNVPDHTVNFVRLILIFSLLRTLASPFSIANKATGKIKVYQICEGCILLAILPISYVFLKLGFQAEIVFVVMIGVEIIAQIVRVIIMRPLINLSVSYYLKNVILPILYVSLLAPILPILYYTRSQSSLVNFIIICIISIICSFMAIYFCGLSKNEKKTFKDRVIPEIKMKFGNKR